MSIVVHMQIRPLDRFTVEVLLNDAGCADCSRPLAAFETIVMRRPVGKKYAFSTCRGCADKRLRAMVEIIKEDVAASFRAGKSVPADVPR